MRSFHEELTVEKQKLSTLLLPFYQIQGSQQGRKTGSHLAHTKLECEFKSDISCGWVNCKSVSLWEARPARVILATGLTAWARGGSDFSPLHTHCQAKDWAAGPCQSQAASPLSKLDTCQAQVTLAELFPPFGGCFT